jgi:hypothetical protein
MTNATLVRKRLCAKGIFGHLSILKFNLDNN